MALDTYDSIVNSLLLRCPLAGGQLAEQFINYSFRDIIERRKWSWSIAQSQFIFPAAATAGTVTVTNNNNSVVGVGTNFLASMIGMQFRTSTLTPIYTITAVGSTTTLTLDQPWGAASASAQGYKIYIAYQIPPTDFHAFTTIYDPNFSWSLWTTVRTGRTEHLRCATRLAGNSLRGGRLRLHQPPVRRRGDHSRAAAIRGLAASAGCLRDSIHV